MASALLQQVRLEQRLLRIAEPSAGTHRHVGRTALRLQPSFIPTYIDLIDRYRQQGREHKVMQTLRKALQVAPPRWCCFPCPGPIGIVLATLARGHYVPSRSGVIALGCTALRVQHSLA
jgi:hypothetical protein